MSVRCWAVRLVSMQREIASVNDGEEDDAQQSTASIGSVVEWSGTTRALEGSMSSAKPRHSPHSNLEGEGNGFYT